MTDQPTADTITPEELADLRRELAGLHITMGLRTCLTPGCLKQYDHFATLTGSQPARPEWPGEGWRQVSRGPATGSICPEHVDAVTAHLPRTVDLPDGRWMVACACLCMSRPQTYGGLLRRTSADFLDHRDWTVDRIDAYLWAILFGWGDRTLQEVAVRHR
ncbi:hypothetical protein ACWD3J_16385 [Streptomyces sp. NPDC002755]